MASKKGGGAAKSEAEMNAANAATLQAMASQLSGKDKNAGAALAAIAAAFSKDVKKSGGAAPGASAGVPVVPTASGDGKLSAAEQAKAVSDALELLSADKPAANLGKVQKKNKPSAPDPRHDVTKLVSVPCFICRPTEFKLLRDTMTDRNLYAATYTDYLAENYEFCHEMAIKQNYQVLRGTWDVRHYLNWCDSTGSKPRASSRKAYFQQLAELAVAGKIDEPKPSFEQYINDTADGGVLRYCCFLGSRGDTPEPAKPVPAGPLPKGTGEATASDTATAAAPAAATTTATAADAKTAPAASGKPKKKKKAGADSGAAPAVELPACGKLETSPNQFALCAGCKCACYCSPECQKKDWKNHKKWCAKVE